MHRATSSAAIAAGDLEGRSSLPAAREVLDGFGHKDQLGDTVGLEDVAVHVSFGEELAVDVHITGPVVAPEAELLVNLLVGILLLRLEDRSPGDLDELLV